eukprot:CAMPEP_0198232246 /NCGR_PEP_ID=MMETSP1445-20131203/115629_1 /TAXON_ID=36898 /ORGANISM="Pyramimonas sp., Strain CCMP2087" /LENGTH=266 /DNA_ID=CAMNT_0043912907 /DNA_START=1059 /DNA_END=1859 /DNA_ORIENTATION=-
MASTALSCRVRAAACHRASCHTIKLPCQKFDVQTSLRPLNLLSRHPAALSGGERRVASRKFSCRASSENNSEPDDAGLDSFRSRMENVWMKEEEKDIQMKLDAAVDAAKEVCEEKPSASDCAIAWEEAQELEMAKKRRKWRRESMNQKVEEEAAEEDRERTPSSLEALLKQTPTLPPKTNNVPPPKQTGNTPQAPNTELPNTTIARQFMESEKPCSNDDCEPATGSFFMAAQLENMFGSSTVEYFEQLLDSVKNPKNKNDDKDDDK